MILWGKWLVNMGGWNIVVIVVNFGGIRHSLPPSLPPPHLGDTERVGGMNINMVSCFYQSMRPLNILLIKI